MRTYIAPAVLIAGIVLGACSRTDEDQDRGAADAPRPAGAPLAVDSMTHAGHEGTASAAPDAHATHGAAPAEHTAAEHVGHAAAGGRGQPADHAGHAAAAAPAGRHAAHDPAAAARDTGHAMHAAARDTGHAMHAVARDTGHAMHAAARDTGHAMHAAAPDTGHVQHEAPAAAAHAGHAPAATEQHAGVMHRMWMRPLGGGWNLLGMAQAFPIVSTSLNAGAGAALDRTELYLTQPAAMFNIESPGSRVVLRTTLNFEGVTQPDGELTFGGWGEGFLDKRHPHTLLHELLLSVNFWNVAGGALSLSAGKGFAPYGTDDPMSRPIVKYPTNHHLSQILERWTVNGAYLNRGWSVEAVVFGGAEPEGPYDLSNIESFADSWSARVARRFGSGHATLAEWEASASYGRVREVHHDEAVITNLYNAALRHETAYSFGSFYGLVEGSVSRPDEGDGYFSVVGETRLGIGRHQPYYRLEYATRPEYAREGLPGTDEFFRYDHDTHAIGATRWLTNSLGYGYELTGYPVSARPFVELKYNRASAERGGIDPVDLFGRRDFWGLSAGFRIFLGGDPMRMGSYGVLDAMTSMHRGSAMPRTAADAHAGHD